MRKGSFERKTKETDIGVEIDLDGTGRAEIDTPVGFLNHMLELFTFFSRMDLRLRAKGDVDVDFHHTVEDIGISIGEAIFGAVSDKSGIHRFGHAATPMD